MLTMMNPLSPPSQEALKPLRPILWIHLYTDNFYHSGYYMVNIADFPFGKMTLAWTGLLGVKSPQRMTKFAEPR